MLDNIPNPSAAGRQGEQLRLVYGDDIRKESNRRQCGGPQGQRSNYASTSLRDMFDNVPNDFEDKYRLPDSMIIFCPAFFGGDGALITDQRAQTELKSLDELRTPGECRNKP